MDASVDHYSILGLPSGEEGAKLSEKEILKAYQQKAIELHPNDDRRDDPNSQAEFQKLHSSYDILKDEKKRKQFDDRLRVERGHCHLQHDAAAAAKMPKMADLELERKRAASIFDPEILAKAREMELLDMIAEFAEFAEFEGKRIQEKLIYWRE